MNLSDVFTNETLRETLEACDWQLHDYNGEAHEFFKIPKDNLLLAIILSALPYSIGHLGDYYYTKEGNFVKRTSKKIIAKTFQNTKFRVEKVLPKGMSQ